MNKILLVDDEQNVLNALKRELRNDFEIEAFQNPVEALECCKDTQFDLIIADYKMPEMNGIEFLKKFGQLQPDASRLLLSGEADIDALLHSINQTHIYRFMSKPWEEAELRSCIHSALAYRETILASRQKSADKASSLSEPRQENDVHYRIVLVENDPHLQTLMLRSMADESGGGNLLSAMQQEFGQHIQTKNFTCSVVSFSNALDAISHIEKNPCDLVITADTLPDMQGMQLLIKLKQLAPYAARILISGNTNKAMLAQAINEAEVQNVLPLHWNSYGQRADAYRQAWNLYQLKSAAIQALASRELLLVK